MSVLFQPVLIKWQHCDKPRACTAAHCPC